jgi:hypothetical protein
MTSGSTGMMVPLVRCEAMVGSTQIAVCTPADPTCPAGTTCQPVPPGPSVLVQWWWSCR